MFNRNDCTFLILECFNNNDASILNRLKKYILIVVYLYMIMFYCFHNTDEQRYLDKQYNVNLKKCIKCFDEHSPSFSQTAINNNLIPPQQWRQWILKIPEQIHELIYFKEEPKGWVNVIYLIFLFSYIAFYPIIFCQSERKMVTAMTHTWSGEWTQDDSLSVLWGET